MKTARWQIQDHTSMVARPNQNLLWETNLKSQQVHFHENGHPPDNSSTETSTQPWYMNVYLMVEWNHLILRMLYKI